MSRAQGQFTVFTIVVIFVMVFMGMYQAWEYAQNPDLPTDTADEQERTARAAIWASVNDWRSENGRYQAPRTDKVEIAAQTTAEMLAADGSFEGPVASGTGIQAGTVLPNAGARCTQLAVAIPVSELGASGEDLTDAHLNRLGDRALEDFRSVDEISVLTRPTWANNGIGVAIEDGTAYVVYRSCITRRYSP